MKMILDKDITDQKTSHAEISKWNFVEFYPEGSSDEFVANHIMPFSKKVKEYRLCEKVFFFRFTDGDRKLRVYFVDVSSSESQDAILHLAESFFEKEEQKVVFSKPFYSGIIDKNDFGDKTVTPIMESFLDFSSVWTTGLLAKNCHESMSYRFTAALQLTLVAIYVFGFKGKQISLLSILGMTDLFSHMDVEKENRKSVMQKMELKYHEEKNRIDVLWNKISSDVRNVQGGIEFIWNGSWVEKLEQSKAQLIESEGGMKSLLGFYKHAIHYTNNQLGLYYSDECYLYFLLGKSYKFFT